MNSGVEIIDLDQRAQWDAALGSAALPSQTWHHAFALQACGIAPQLAVVHAGGATLRMVFHERDFAGTTDIATVPGGSECPLHAVQQVYDSARFEQLCAAAPSGTAWFPPYRAGAGG